MRIPKNLDRQIDKLYELEREVAGATLTLQESPEYKMLEKAKKNYEELQQHIIGSHHIEVLESATGRDAKLVISKRINYRISEWDELKRYVVKHDAYDIFQRRITPSAIADREADGEVIPGLEKYTNITIKPKHL